MNYLDHIGKHWACDEKKTENVCRKGTIHTGSPRIDLEIYFLEQKTGHLQVVFQSKHIYRCKVKDAWTANDTRAPILTHDEFCRTVLTNKKSNKIKKLYSCKRA